MLCVPYKRSLDILQQNWTFGTKGQKLQMLCVWQKRTGEVKVHLVVSYALIIAASEKWIILGNLPYTTKAEKRLSVFFASLSREILTSSPQWLNSQVPKPLHNQLGTPPVPCPISQFWVWPNSSATGKYITEFEILPHLGSVNLQMLSKTLQDVYLTVCWYQKDPCYTVAFINKTIYCLKLK